MILCFPKRVNDSKCSKTVCQVLLNDDEDLSNFRSQSVKKKPVENRIVSTRTCLIRFMNSINKEKHVNQNQCLSIIFQ